LAKQELLKSINVNWYLKASSKDNIHPLLVYHCKSCGVNTSSSKWRKNDRRRCIWHLAYAHSTDYQDLAAQLNVAPGPRLDDLLFQAMAPGMIYHAKKSQ